MTFVEIVGRVASRLNLSSPEALTRIGDEVNDRYRRVCAAIGMETTTRATATANTAVGYRTLTFTSVVKLFTVLDADDKQIDEESYTQLVKQTPHGDPPTAYAVKTMGATSVTILLDCTPVTIYTMSADALVVSTLLSGSAEPAFAENFHDILVFGAMADELEKMEKARAADKREVQYDLRLSDLRYFIAKSAYRDIVQGGATTRSRWLR
jgi:hypothetical protein